MATPSAARAASTRDSRTGGGLHHHHRLRFPPIIRSCGRSFSASLSSSRSARGQARPPRKRPSSISFHRQDGSRITFPGAVRAWCERDALYVVTLGRTNQSRWQLSVARNALAPRRTVVFNWEHARGITLFVFDAQTRNEASESAEGSRGHVVLRRATCTRGGAVEIAVSAAHRQRVLRRLEDSSVRSPEGEDRSPTAPLRGGRGAPRARGSPLRFYCVMRIATSYFETDVRCPGVSSLGIALRISSPRA